MQAVSAQETAQSLTDSLDETDSYKQLVKHHLENTVRPSGDATTDLRNARAIVDGVRNSQLAEEAARSQAARRAPSSPSAPPAQGKEEPELTKEQAQFARMTGLSPEEAARALS
jgi:hypothetical protein